MQLWHCYGPAEGQQLGRALNSTPPCAPLGESIDHKQHPLAGKKKNYPGRELKPTDFDILLKAVCWIDAEGR